MTVGEVTDIYCPTCRRMNRGWLHGYATLRKATCLTCGTVQVKHDEQNHAGTTAEGVMR